MSSRQPPEPIAHIHLEPVGGIAGDMFAAAILDAFPDLETGLLAMLSGVGLPEAVAVDVRRERRAGIAGRRFIVTDEDTRTHDRSGRELERFLEAAALAEPVRAWALAGLGRLVTAEAAVHGVRPEEVHFHELGGWDTVVDLLAAAWLVDALGRPAWSVAPLPLGGGSIRTAHGLLPVPAPATAAILEGFAWVDDGIGGERVTPTGAAILRQLAPEPVSRRAGRLLAGGWGLGARELAGVPNGLRVMAFANAAPSGRPDPVARDEVAVLRCEIDDQPAEDLALGLDRIRAADGVVDVCQWPVVGKRGRLATAVQVLCAPSKVEQVARLCLAETGTLGLRLRLEERRVLERELLSVPVERETMPVKRATRPDGVRSAKAELAALEASGTGFAGRRRLARRAEAAALDEGEE